MPRKGPVSKSPVIADPVYNSPIVTALINKVLLSGKRSTAEGIVYGALEGVRDKTNGIDPVITLKRALDNVKPTVEVKSRRVGGSTYQVPVEVRPVRRNALAMRWIVDAARKRGEKGMVSRLAAEMIEAFEGRGAAVKKREETHRMAKANQAFAHFRFN